MFRIWDVVLSQPHPSSTDVTEAGMKFVCVTEFGARSDTYEQVLKDSASTAQARDIKASAHVATWGATDLMEIAVADTPYALLRPSGSYVSSFRRATAGVWFGPGLDPVPVGGLSWGSPDDVVAESKDEPFAFACSLRLPLSLRMMRETGRPVGLEAVDVIYSDRWLHSFEVLKKLNQVEGTLTACPLVGLDQAHVLIVGRSSRPDLFSLFIWSILTLQRGKPDVNTVKVLWDYNMRDWAHAPMFSGCVTRCGVRILGNELAGLHNKHLAGYYATPTRVRGDVPADIFTNDEIINPVFGFFDGQKNDSGVLQEQTVGELSYGLQALRTRQSPILTYTDLVMKLDLSKAPWPSGAFEEQFRKQRDAGRRRYLQCLNTLEQTADQHHVPHGLEDAVRELITHVVMHAAYEDDAIAPLLPAANILATSPEMKNIAKRYSQIEGIVQARARREQTHMSSLAFEGFSGYRVGRDAFASLMTSVASRGGLKAPLIHDTAIPYTQTHEFHDGIWVINVPARGFRHPYTWSHGIHELGHALVDRWLSRHVIFKSVSLAATFREAVADYLMFCLLEVPNDTALERDGWLLLGPRLLWETNGRVHLRTRAMICTALLAAGPEWEAFRAAHKVAQECVPHHIGLLPAQRRVLEIPKEKPEEWDKFAHYLEVLVSKMVEPDVAIATFRTYLARLRPLFGLDDTPSWPVVQANEPGNDEIVFSLRRRLRFGAGREGERQAVQRLTIDLLLDLDEIGRLDRLSPLRDLIFQPALDSSNRRA